LSIDRPDKRAVQPTPKSAKVAGSDYAPQYDDGIKRPKRGGIKDDIRVLFFSEIFNQRRMDISSNFLSETLNFEFHPFGLPC
jgi:hypothetical protein